MVNILKIKIILILTCITIPTAVSTYDLHEHLNRAYSLAVNYHYEQALEHFNLILQHNPYSLQPLYNKAFIFKKTGKLHEAIPVYEQVLALNPHHVKAHYGLGQVLLTLGNFERGWYEFQWRLFEVDKYKQKPIDPTTLSGKTVILRAELGLGDMFQFIRYAKLFKQYGAQVIVQVYKQLIPLFSLCDYIDHVVEESKPLPMNYMHIPLLSTPITFHHIYPTIYIDTAYLVADKTLEQEWKEKLAHDTYFKIGICWQSGGHDNYPLTKRSVSLAIFKPISELPGISLYSLQKQSNDELNKQLPKEMIVHHLGDNFDEKHGPFMDTAAVIKNLDLVISVDTSIAHLAGALGMPVWLLIPPIPDWRWLLAGTNSAWYPTAQLFRRQKDDSWESVIQQIVEELKIILDKK